MGDKATKIFKTIDYLIPIGCYLMGTVTVCTGGTTTDALLWMVAGNTYTRLETM